MQQLGRVRWRRLIGGRSSSSLLLFNCTLRVSPSERYTGFINGEFLPNTEDARYFDVRNPSTGVVITTVMNMTVSQTENAIQAANTAWTKWKVTTGVERSRVMSRVITLMREHKEALATIITLETGIYMFEVVMCFN
jgi:acyl-CoA reductase-like NAD-dependent aldehyde dehydrogenase